MFHTDNIFKHIVNKKYEINVHIYTNPTIVSQIRVLEIYTYSEKKEFKNIKIVFVIDI